MALNAVKFTLQTGGLAKPLAGEDHISGLVLYLPSLPTGFSVSKFRFGSLAEAEAATIINAGATASIWYHIAEFFRINPGATLYLSWVLHDSGFDGSFHEVKELQAFAEGAIRQFGVAIPNLEFNVSQLGNLQTRMQELFDSYMPAVVIYAPKVSSATLAALTNLRTLTHRYVSVLIGKDGGGYGKDLAGHAAIGTCLGSVSKSKVHESIAWVEKNNTVSTAYPNKAYAELSLPAFTDGTLIRDVFSSVQDAINDKGYLFLRKHTGIEGTYWNDAFSADAVTSDYNNIYANRTIQKAVRGMRSYLLPRLSSPVSLNADGTLRADTVKFFEQVASQPLQVMLAAGELSAYSVAIDSNQSVASTGVLQIITHLVPIGVANNIEVNIGYTLSIA